MKREEDLFLGRLAVREGLCTAEEVEECLSTQANLRAPAPLGELLVLRRSLTSGQLKLLLAKQQKKLMDCPACRLSFTVLTVSGKKTVDCPRCKAPLRESGPGKPTRTDAEFATRTTRAVSSTSSPLRTPTRATFLACQICDTRFEEAPDPAGRVRCPSCQSTFAARR